VGWGRVTSWRGVPAILHGSMVGLVLRAILRIGGGPPAPNRKQGIARRFVDYIRVLDSNVSLAPGITIHYSSRL